MAVVFASVIGTQSLRADDITASAPTISAVTAMPAIGDLPSGFPGLEIGIIGVGAPITGVPCFSCPTPGSLTITTPYSVVTHGTPFQAFFTVQLTSVSGTGPVTLELIKNNVVIYKATGSLTFNPNSLYIVSSGGTVPSVFGPVVYAVTMTLGTSTVRSSSLIYIQ